MKSVLWAARGEVSEEVGGTFAYRLSIEGADEFRRGGFESADAAADAMRRRAEAMRYAALAAGRLGVTEGTQEP